MGIKKVSVGTGKKILSENAIAYKYRGLFLALNIL
jgi:hypothetical protein